MTVRACPICKKAAVADYRPFCSRRCADVDLQRWLTGRYALGGEDQEELDGPRLGDRGDGPTDR
jgi:endogenous inhibitor of DNA gyrase (YacG/DUF329 family)